MIIINKTGIDIITDRNTTINSNSSYVMRENIFDTLNLHSSIGSIIITSEYNVISARPFGNLDAVVDKENRTITIMKRW